ncbi:MAG: hypothetical protein ISS49_02600 [Anaerolineae bacterium]|nr:hypothetical protein [Anaerolineae bacterium]
MTTKTDERLKILQMLEEDKITAEEAATLLRAMDGGRRAAPGAPGPGRQGRYLRIQVTDLPSGTGKVNVTIPVEMVKAGLRIAERFAPGFEDLDLQELGELIASGAIGKIVEVMDAEDNERVEIYVE